MKNMNLAENLIRKLIAIGVEEFCICAGARNSPLVEVFECNSQLKVFHFFEERSAGFFALGRIAKTKKPVAVMTTSGTAVAELLPAVIEAFYTGAPLIVVSADRPKKYRGSGAPQAIEQLGIFSDYVEKCLDIDELPFEFKDWKQKSALQINICFDEPLLDRPAQRISQVEGVEAQLKNEEVSKEIQTELQNFLNSYQPLVVVSALSSTETSDVLALLKKLNAPVYAEALSGIRGHQDLQGIEILGGDLSASSMIRSKQCNAILRIGGVPTLRLWRDLEEVYKDIPVFSLSQNHFTGLARKEKVFDVRSTSVLKEFPIKNLLTKDSYSFEIDLKAKQFLNELLRKYPLSEQSWYRVISNCTNQDSVYVGNSLPVRQWDLLSKRHFQGLNRIYGNRGANGIDGQLSTFFGWAETAENKKNWCVLGDLTTLYDLSAPWILSQIQNLNFNLVIMNNKGGQIFKRMFGDKKLFLNSHQVEFSSWAQMWNLEYCVLSTESDQKKISEIKSNQTVIEIHPDSEQTDNFNNDWQLFWKNVI